MTLRFRFTALAIAALGAAAPASAQQPHPPAAPGCPQMGWSEGLWSNFQRPDSAFPTKDTHDQPKGVPDCIFHQWSVEAFVWATTLDKQNVPRFMTAFASKLTCL
jgi:hypothetical protein